MSQHPKRESSYPPPLKINKHSHFIKKTSPSSSSSSNSSLVNGGVSGAAKPPPQHRHPVIIYTHSPKVIHTHPQDFMALVQKLTGLSRSHNDDDIAPKDQTYAPNGSPEEEMKGVKPNNNNSNNGSDENDSSSSVITEENSEQVNSSSCFIQPVLDLPNPYVTNIPIFTPNLAEFLCANQPFHSYRDSLYFNPSNMRSSISSASSALEGLSEFVEY